MILKVGRAHPHEEDSDVEYTWTFVEGITSLHKSTNKIVSKDEACFLIYTSDCARNNFIDREMIDDVHYVTLKTLDECYLMNDDGKTIERIR